MSKNVKLPCGINRNGEVVYITDAKNGLECGCFCPGCSQPLIAKNNGKVNEPHFAHKSKDFNCEHGFQSAVHYMAKDVFMEMKYFTFVKNGEVVKYKIDNVLIEQRLDKIIPDIILSCDGKCFIVEIFVTHSVDDEKKLKIRNMMISALEINISHLKDRLIDKNILREELNKISNFSWIYDADEDLIEQKRNIVSKYGFKLEIQEGKSILCPMLVKQRNQLFRFVPLAFCLQCHNCVYKSGNKFISCGKILPLPLNQETRKKLSDVILVNSNKVMFDSEYKQYMVNFQLEFENAVNRQSKIIQNIRLQQLYNAALYAYQSNNLQKNYNNMRESRSFNKKRYNYFYRKKRW